MTNPALTRCGTANPKRAKATTAIFFEFTHDDGRKETITCECIVYPYSALIANEITRLVEKQDSYWEALANS